MRDIAEASDLLAGSLYSHFRSKAHLLELVILPFYDELIPGQRAALEHRRDRRRPHRGDVAPRCWRCAPSTTPS